jgi:uncharacterized integral membrane protein (TIGR00697 family)
MSMTPTNTPDSTWAASGTPNSQFAPAPLAATTLITGLYVACDLIANVTASTAIFLGRSFAVPGGVFLYALTFTLLDLAHEHTGQEGARRLVYTSFAANVLLAGYVQAIAFLGRNVSLSWSGANPCLGGTPRVVAASLTAYLLSSLVDLRVFAWWRRHGRGPRWTRVLASNTVSTLVDSVVFIGIAFGLVVTAAEAPVIPRLIAGQYAVKMVITLASLPLIYAVRGKGRGPIGKEERLSPVSGRSV